MLRRMRWIGNVECMGEKRNAYKALMVKPERKMPEGKHRHRWDDIEMVHKEIGGGV
jgi:hypothetical protein